MPSAAHHTWDWLINRIFYQSDQQAAFSLPNHYRLQRHWHAILPDQRKTMLLSSESSDDDIETSQHIKLTSLSTHNSKKRKKTPKSPPNPTQSPVLQHRPTPKTTTPRPETKQTPQKGRTYTVSIAIPGSIIDNAQTKELKTYLAGQIARAAVIFEVDEIVVFNDHLGKESDSKSSQNQSHNDCHTFLIRVLQYLETPQYLRKALFPMHPDLHFAGILNPLDCAHHLKNSEYSLYREGVVTDRRLKETEGSFVYVGLPKEVAVKKRIHPGIRVTIKMQDEKSKKFVGKLVSPKEPREKEGLYWGYTCRYAPNLSQALNDCPFDGGYDLKIGTSERGHESIDDQSFHLPPFKHILIVFGGVAGIEQCVHAEETIAVSGDDAHTLFDQYVNTCPTQGSRTIRTEEAILISLAALRSHVYKSGSATLL